MVSGTLVTNYHTVTCGQELLKPWEEGDLYEDFLLDGQEPRLSRQTAADTPDVPGATNGALFGRGNTRWQASITRVVSFHGNTYPLTDGATVYQNPQQHAQQWLATHLKALPDTHTAFAWNTAVFAKAVISADGTTDGAFVRLNYNIIATEAS